LNLICLNIITFVRMIKLSFFSRLALLCTVAVLLASCHHDRLKIDVSGINVPPVKIDRLEKDMFSMPPDSVYQRDPAIEKKYGKFYTRFVMDVIYGGGGVMDSTYAASLKRFITDKDMRLVYDTCEILYPDMKFLEGGLTDAFKHYKYYFPDKPLPRVITAISGFSSAIAYTDSTLEISLDWYLGKKSPYYVMLRWPQYQFSHCDKAYMLSDAVYGWLKTMFKPVEDKNDMLAQIVHEGKLRYLTDALLPDINDTLKIWYSGKQLAWCKENEFNMWAYIVQKNLLYSTDQSDVVKFTDDGPFTEAFNHDYSPARVGYWLGWQIVRSYMKNNSKVTLADLMNEPDADKILRKSGYKPSK